MKEISLSNHPVKKIVIEFIRSVVVDSLYLPSSTRLPQTIDLILDSYPQYTSLIQQTQYQTEVLSILMEHIQAADILTREQMRTPIMQGGSSNNIINNVCYLSARIVDKLWQGMIIVLIFYTIIKKIFNCNIINYIKGTLTKNPHEVFDFLIILINQAKKRSSAVNIEGLHHCLNRTILFLLSRSTNYISDQTSVLEALHKLTIHR